MGQQAGLKRNQHRHDGRQNLSVFQTLHCTDQFNGTAKGLGELNILQRDVTDALGVNAFRIDVLFKYQRGENADLPAGILAVYIGRGVTLCIAQLLCQC